MGKGARNRRQRAAEREQEGVPAPGGMVDTQALGRRFGAAAQWKQPNSPDEAITQVAEYMKSLPKLIVCGQLGLDPLPEGERRELLSGCGLFDVLETISRLQSRWDVAFTTTQRPDIVEAEFLAGGDGEACRRARVRVMQYRDLLVSSRATAQLQREIIESASTDESAATIDRNTLVHMLLSITTEQNMDSEFAGDIPTEDEIAKLEREIPKMNLEEMLKYVERLVPDEVASNLFNSPLKYEMLLSNTYDVWFTAWPSRSKITGLGTTPAEAFKIAAGVELLDVMRLGHRIIKRSTDNHQVRFTRDELIADGASGPAVDHLFSNMTLSLDDYRAALEKDRESGDIAHQRFTLTQYPFLRVDEGTIVMVRHQWAMERFAGATLYFEAWFNLRGQSRGLADRFKNAMNDAFEFFVGGILHRIANRSPSIRIVDEAEMQAAWQQQKGKTPSVCDWMLLGEKHCAVIDATNHAVKEDVAQGLATFAEYAADIDKIFVEGKFEQLLSTIELAQTHGGWADDVVDADTDFAPLVVVPDTGVPNGILTQFDIIERGRKLFQHLQPHVYVPGIVPVSDIQLLEGMADLARSVPMLPGQDRNMMKMLAGWRYAASGQGEASLQVFLHRRGFPLPLSKHILSNSRKMIALLDGS